MECGNSEVIQLIGDVHCVFFFQTADTYSSCERSFKASDMQNTNFTNCKRTACTMSNKYNNYFIIIFILIIILVVVFWSYMLHLQLLEQKFILSTKFSNIFVICMQTNRLLLF